VTAAAAHAPEPVGPGDPDPVGPHRLEALVPAAVAGDPRAREELLAELQPMVLRYCRGRLGRQETVLGSAEDVAQDVCMAVVNALGGYTVKGLSFRAFVYGIAAHKVTDAFRAIGRNRSDPVAELPDAPVAHDGPEQRLLATELTRRLAGLLAGLTPRQREVLVLRIAVGLSAEETAAAVGSTPGAVRVTQHRALNRLRGLIGGGAPVAVAGSGHDGAGADDAGHDDTGHGTEPGPEAVAADDAVIRRLRDAAGSAGAGGPAPVREAPGQ
jgi:RNA polymerase sigma-70 factor, ECF subfamily